MALPSSFRHNAGRSPHPAGGVESVTAGRAIGWPSRSGAGGMPPFLQVSPGCASSQSSTASNQPPVKACLPISARDGDRPSTFDRARSWPGSAASSRERVGAGTASAAPGLGADLPPARVGVGCPSWWSPRFSGRTARRGPPAIVQRGGSGVGCGRAASIVGQHGPMTSAAVGVEYSCVVDSAHAEDPLDVGQRHLRVPRQPVGRRMPQVVKRPVRSQRMVSAVNIARPLIGHGRNGSGSSTTTDRPRPLATRPSEVLVEPQPDEGVRRWPATAAPPAIPCGPP